ncbi:hypothetical protein D3C76_1445390 [compost metagenome]
MSYGHSHSLPHSSVDMDAEHLHLLAAIRFTAAAGMAMAAMHIWDNTHLIADP